MLINLNGIGKFFFCVLKKNPTATKLLLLVFSSTFHHLYSTFHTSNKAALSCFLCHKQHKRITNIQHFLIQAETYETKQW